MVPQVVACCITGETGHDHCVCREMWRRDVESKELMCVILGPPHTNVPRCLLITCVQSHQLQTYSQQSGALNGTGALTCCRLTVGTLPPRANGPCHDPPPSISVAPPPGAPLLPGCQGNSAC